MVNDGKTYSSAVRNSALCRKDLDLITNGNFVSEGYQSCRKLCFFKVNGVTRFWEKDVSSSFHTLAGDILASCARHEVPFAFAIVGDENGIGIYVGTMKLLRESLRSAYEAVYAGIDIDSLEHNPLDDCPRNFGGMFTGIPTNKIGGEQKSLQIENICRGMQGRRFTYLILASGMSHIAVTQGHERLLREMDQVSLMLSQTVSGGIMGNLSIQKQDFSSKNYFDNLEILEQSLREGASRGVWRMNGYYAADTPTDAQKLSNIIKATYSGVASRPEPFRVIDYRHISDVLANMYMMADQSNIIDYHPLGSWLDEKNREYSLYVYKYQTILTSDQMAVMCQLPTKEFPGYYIDEYVEFDISSRIRGQLRQPVPIGSICSAGRKMGSQANNLYELEKNDLTRHALIIGITGGGKTNTSKYLLSTLWNAEQPADRIPFLAIESAKREYWELRNLKGFEDLLVFTLGAEAEATSVRYRINPFETKPGISLQTHIDYLLSTFKAAFDLYAPMPYILETAVYEVYADRGWDIVENTNRYGLTEYPTLSDLYKKIDVVVDRMGYHQEVQSNVKAALQARIHSLMIGGKGAMLNTPKSIPIEMLLSRPVVMELEDLGDDETKSFVIGILLVQLYEYRKSQMGKGSKQLSHILMVEEAHRLLKNVPKGGDGGNTRAKSVEFFCNLLAEIRTFGQGIFIADQIPTKLAPDTIKNTNLKIVHRTVAQDDRETIGRAMNMSAEQIDYLSSLRRGYAAVYSEGDSRPKCVKIPLVESYYEKEREEVIAQVQQLVRGFAGGYDQNIHYHEGCAFCEKRCQYRQRVMDYMDGKVDLEKVMQKLHASAFSGQKLNAFLNSAIMKPLGMEDVFGKLCVIGYILSYQKDFNDGQKQKILADYLEYTYKQYRKWR